MEMNDSKILCLYIQLVLRIHHVGQNQGRSQRGGRGAQAPYPQELHWRKAKRKEEERRESKKREGVGAGSGTGCSPAWSCTPRRCDSSTAFQASRRALRLPSTVDAWCLVLRWISSSTRLASAAAPRKDTAAKSAGSSPNFHTICACVCTVPSGVCTCVCAGAEWCVAINATPWET